MYLPFNISLMTVTEKKGTPRYDGGGGGTRNYINRGGCNSPQPIGKGRRNSVVY